MENFHFLQILEDSKHEHKPFVKIPLRSQGAITLSLSLSPLLSLTNKHFASKLLWSI